MTDPNRKLDEAHALFEAFRRGSWASLHLRAVGLEMFVSRMAGAANPMNAGPAAPVLPAPDGGALKAPHLGTLTALASLGERIEAGQAFAALRLLDDRVDLLAEEAGVVIEHLAAIDSLVEHDQPLIRLR